jgi:hypothetical protein
MAEIYFDVDTALSEVPVNIFPLTDDTDFKTRETGITYNQAGMDLVWNFVTTAGAYTQTAVTPTTGGSYDWTHQGDGMYSIEMPASGGASINNDTEGFGWFTGICTGVLPWRSPIFGFRAAGINNKLIDDAYDTTRGLAGTALPAAAADAAGGIPISDAGGLDLDTLLGTLTNATYGLSAIENLVDDLESRLTAARAGYLDKLNITGDVAGATPLATMQGNVTDILADTNEVQGKIIGTIAAGTHNPQSGDSYGRIGVNGAGLSALGDTRIAFLDASILSRSSHSAADVWSVTTRTLSSFGSLVSDIATAVWGAATRTLSAFGFTVTATGVSDIKTKTDQLTFTTANKVDATATVSTAGLATEVNQTLIRADIAALNNISVANILAGQTEAGLTLAHAMQIITALALKASGGGGTTISFRNYGDTKNRLVMTVDENGNRSNVVVSFD